MTERANIGALLMLAGIIIAGVEIPPTPARYRSLAPRASRGGWLARVEREARRGVV